ncbi:MAG: class I SAM-dependent methyltransferase [Deltaproteobacteria bacterium]|nr:class I SAM-dependent methyltransferase [Deltaproteobacteria bacterium]
MKPGDYTELAKHYFHRPGYSKQVLKALALYMDAARDGFLVADIGAGTGKLTGILMDLGLSGYAIEPNEAMREEGLRLCRDRSRVKWSKGTAEETGLSDASVDWILMASSFHWTNSIAALAEFHRILRPGGFFSALWNPRDLEKSPLQKRIEEIVCAMAPGLKRVSSGAEKYTRGLEQTLIGTGHFHHPIFMEAPHEETMDRQRYLGVWRSVNDLQAQAGELKFQEILDRIESEISGLDRIVVPYKTRAWTVQKKLQ